MRPCLLALASILSLAVAPAAVHAERIKDLARVSGVRDNQLIGYGLVVGLNGTGDQTGQAPFTVQSLKSMLNRFGVQIPPEVRPQLKNVAAVMISANLPPFAKPGQTIDLTVSTIGNAKSLLGGTLLMTPLKGADGQTYAIAQGNLTVGGFGTASGDGSSVSVNVPTVGRVPNGATVERAAPTPLGGDGDLVLDLQRSDFTTAKRIADAVNQSLGSGTAEPIDATSVRLAAPADPSQRVAYLSHIENLTLKAADAPARVIVSSRNGTVVINRQVTVSAAAVAHGNLSVTVTNDPLVSQPAPFSDGRTVVVPNQNIDVQQQKARAFMFNPGVTLQDIVRAINQVGAAPSDLIAILEALREAGALHAELVVI
jgi:flagellar P-ring protein precursor FlgI